MAKIDMFEHLKDPVDTMKLEATFRLWQALPFFSSIITNHLVELLKEKNAWRQSLKQDINNAIKCLKPQSEKFINRLMSQEEEEYFDYLSLGLRIIWSEEKIYFPLENGDFPAIMENQRISKIKFKNLSNEYKANIAFLINDIDPEIGNKQIRNIIKSL